MYSWEVYRFEYPEGVSRLRAMQPQLGLAFREPDGATDTYIYIIYIYIYNSIYIYIHIEMDVYMETCREK